MEKSEKIQKYKDIFTHQLIDLSQNFLGLERFFQKNAPQLAPTLKHRKPDIISPNLLTTRDLVLSHSGIAMLPDFLIQSELKKKKVVPVFPKAKKLFGTTDIAFKKYRNLRHYEKLFWEHCITNHSEGAD